MIFDLWDTLTEPSAQRDRGRFTREVGELLGADGEAFADLVVAAFSSRCRGELGGLNATLRSLCRQLGVDPTPSEVEAAAAHRMVAQAQLMRLRDDAIATVERFRMCGWRIGLLTDSTCETETLWQQLELRRLFDAAVFSCSEGRSKPDPLFYEAVVRRLGVVPLDCLYVADGRSDELAGAAMLGMRCIQLRSAVGQDGSENSPGEKVFNSASSPISS